MHRHKTLNRKKRSAKFFFEKRTRAPSSTALEKQLVIHGAAIFYTITNCVITTRWICSLLSSYHCMGVVYVAQICNLPPPFSWCHFDLYHVTTGREGKRQNRFLAFTLRSIIKPFGIVSRRSSIGVCLLKYSYKQRHSSIQSQGDNQRQRTDYSCGHWKLLFVCYSQSAEIKSKLCENFYEACECQRFYLAFCICVAWECSYRYLTMI